eukprot:CAMPEP_0180486334 /NCGR_PEP_ID=MMETSP1036_2-20121128/36943_1 /TAXON_ID=632150 /ORGANISM="Azadinium spinosum, Strain 3D9" /LENGTH=49 /DNA_ID= /DNA_START= /DNA_END= /DNA_ORIENTATION=
MEAPEGWASSWSLGDCRLSVPDKPIEALSHATVQLLSIPFYSQSATVEQ